MLLGQDGLPSESPLAGTGFIQVQRECVTSAMVMFITHCGKVIHVCFDFEYVPVQTTGVPHLRLQDAILFKLI